MRNMNSTAGAVRRNKEAHPERYCADKRCLWAVRSGPCPKHMARVAVVAEQLSKSDHESAAVVAGEACVLYGSLGHMHE